MLLVQDVMISDDIIEEEFICNLSACKGACCWKGDYGAPVTKKEIDIIEKDLDKITPYLSKASIDKINEEGIATFYKEPGFDGTTLHPNGACTFMTTNELGIALCGIEKANREGKIDFIKPRSCHLYPIRVIVNEDAGFEAWNYDQWDICSAACKLGKREKVPIYKFLKNAIINYKGKDFYEELEAAVEHFNASKGS